MEILNSQMIGGFDKYLEIFIVLLVITVELQQILSKLFGTLELVYVYKGVLRSHPGVFLP